MFSCEHLYFILLTLKLVQCSGSVAFRFASYFGDHMVVQSSPAQAAVWGFAGSGDVGRNVSLSLTTPGSNDTLNFTAPVVKGVRSVTWRVLLPFLTPGGPYSIRAELTHYPALSLTDVMAGDVWLCSGQSNMQFTVPMMLNGSHELDTAHLYPLIRLFTVAQTTSSYPRNELQKILQPWTVASKEALQGPGVGTYFSAICWLFGKNIHSALGRPIGLIASDWADTTIQAWSSTRALKRCNRSHVEVRDNTTDINQKTPSSLWNAMIHPLLNMTILGVVWYQGESNVGHKTEIYNCSFPALINDWRAHWYNTSDEQTDRHFPFGFVQIGPSDGKDIGLSKGGFAEIRWHQTADSGEAPNRKMPNTFMATAMDLTDLESPYSPMHYRDKQTVAKRLSLGALNIAYEQTDVEFQGPVETSYSVNDFTKTLTIEFDNATRPIEVRSQNGFEVCCGDDNNTFCRRKLRSGWKPAPIAHTTNTAIVLNFTACDGKWLMGYRYAWRDTPCLYKQCAVYSLDKELPLVPRVKYGVFNATDSEDGQITNWSPNLDDRMFTY